MPILSRIVRMCCFLLIPMLGLLAAPGVQARPPTASRDGLLHDTLAGEFALQSGKLDEAARWYLDAARAAEGDAGLAERATRIALLAKDNDRAAAGLALWRRRAPESLTQHAAAATLALRRDDDRQALRELQTLLRQSDTAGWALAVAVLGGGDNPGLSARVLRQLLQSRSIPGQLQAWLAMGGVAQRLNDAALAEQIVGEVIRRFPNHPEAKLLQVSQLRESDRRDEARKALDALAAGDRINDTLRLALAAEYEALGDDAAAAAVLAQGTQTDRSYRLRASLLDRAKDSAGLQSLYDELKQHSSQPDPERRLLLGQIAESLKHHDQALQWYAGVPGGDARWLAALRTANVLHAMQRGDEAFKALQALQTNAAAGDGVRRNAYLLEAELHAKDAPRGAAELDAFARGLAAFPDDSAILYARALSWERRDDIPRAEADLRKILLAEPDSTAALNALGYTLADRTTRYQEALELIDRARAADPDNAAIIDSYGWVLYRLGRKQEALVELRRAFILQKDPEIAAHVAEVLWELGRKDEARQWFDEARKLDPENRALQRALEKTGA
ncbi:MAG: hypothetical protein DI635_07225 [Pseudoxanthomonas suwonensis]|nr:MAG: hypothetical protein DI635_07225 [Pseudoxanthomonas suwonensis]